MTLSDPQTYCQVIGGLMLNPLLILEYSDISPGDFDDKVARICCISILNLYREGAESLSTIEVDQEIERTGGNTAKIYHDNNGLDFLKNAYEHANPGNFELYYNRLKKNSLLRRLKKEHYDISEFYIEDTQVANPSQEAELKQKLDNASLADILNTIEGKYNTIRNDYLNGGKMKGDPAEGLNDLIETLQKTPSIGPSLEGEIFSAACRGARAGCFFLKSASTSAGKSRTSVFDACHLAYPIRWSHEEKTFIEEFTKSTNEVRQPRKVLFIVTEMDKEELQTIMLAYLSGVDEDHILRGAYEVGELNRVKYAAKIIEKYSGYFIIEEISDPNLVNIQSTIKKYATVDEVKYVFFDYIHTTASLMEQFSRNHLREDVVLMMMANQLKQLAKDYNIFIFSATQVNAGAMVEDGEFKNETNIRGAKSIADKADMGCVMTRVNDKIWNALLPALRVAAADGRISSDIINKEECKPTHIIDIYKMRRGRYKNIRIWLNLHLGTGYRKDLFMTNADNQPEKMVFTLFDSMNIRRVSDFKP